MKRKITSVIGFLGIFILPLTEAIAQTTANWALNANANAVVTDGITAGPATSGVGFRSGGISAKTYTANGISSTNWTNATYASFSLTSSQYNQDYYQYTVAPDAGNDYTVNSISFQASASTGTISWLAYYSLDGFLTYTAIGGKNGTSHSGLNITVPQGKTFALRIYGMDFVASTTAFRNRNVTISGTVSPACVPRTADAGGNISMCQGTTSQPLNGSVGGSATIGKWASDSGGDFVPSSGTLNAQWTPPSNFTGTATLTLVAIDGCSTEASSQKLVTVNAVSLTPAVNLTQNGTTLVSTNTGVSYQWIRCDQNNAPITGATSQSFVPQETGNYAVVLTSSSCPNITATSQCIAVDKDNVTVPGTFTSNGEATFAQKASFQKDVFLEDLEDGSVELGDTIEDESFLIVKSGTGKVVKSTVAQMQDRMYDLRLCFDGDSPVWSNGPDKLYTLCGNVGIGTNAPSQRLHVVGNGYFTNSLQIDQSLAVGTVTNPFSRFILRNNNRDAALHIDQSGNNKNFAKLMFFEYTHSGTEIIKVVNSQTGHMPLLIDVNGNVRIKNATRDIFHINADLSTVYARKIVVDEQTWPDYVFEKDYQLLPLPEVKSFIRENGHLPNVPSRETILKEGADLGGMVHILLEKVEELTLYTIKQQEEIEALKKMVEQHDAQK